MSEYFTALRTTKTFDDIYPNGVPKLKLPNVRTAIGDSMYDKLVDQGDLIPSKDGNSDFVPLAVLLFVILTPYQPQLSVGGGGGGQSSGWGKKDDDDERWKFKFNMSVLHSKSKKPQYKPKR